MSVLELLQHIVNGPASRLTPEVRFLKAAGDFVDRYYSRTPKSEKHLRSYRRGRERRNVLILVFGAQRCFGGFSPPARLVCSFVRSLPLVLMRLLTVSCFAQYISFLAQVLPGPVINVYVSYVCTFGLVLLMSSSQLLLMPPANLSSILGSDVLPSLPFLSPVSSCFPFDLWSSEYPYCHD